MHPSAQQSRKPLETSGFLHLPECNSIRTLARGGERGPRSNGVNRASAEPEVVFRIVHVAIADGSSSAAYRDQTVEVALGPSPVFRDGDVGRLTRRVRPCQVVNAVPPSRRRRARPPKPPKPVGPPPIVAMFRKAIEWRLQLDAGEVPNQAAIARREGITRARVTQILGLLRLPDGIRRQISQLQDGSAPTMFSEHALRAMVRIADDTKQQDRPRTRRATARRHDDQSVMLAVATRS